MASGKLTRCERRDSRSPSSDGRILIPCPARAVFRDLVREKLVEENFQELCDQLYPSKYTANDRQIIADCPLASKLRDVAGHFRNSNIHLVDEMCANLVFPDDPTEAKRALANVTRRVMRIEGWGRLLSLAFFSSCVACRCADRGPDYVACLMDDLEDFVDNVVHDWVEKADKESAWFSDLVNRWMPGAWKKQRHVNTGLALGAGALIAGTAVIFKVLG